MDNQDGGGAENVSEAAEEAGKKCVLLIGMSFIFSSGQLRSVSEMLHHKQIPESNGN